ncbi:MAG: hypothetical protein HC857_09365 [Synechococcales cyanobacterium RU_4_20]|nr:hypothetical protein [Synechococcales cyanobacterium RU_4_20]
MPWRCSRPCGEGGKHACPWPGALNEIGQSQNIPELLTEAAGLYRAELQETSAPSSTLLLEAADVLSGIPAERAFARQLYGQIAQAEPNNRVVVLKLVVLDAQLGRIGQTEASQRVLALVQPLPTQLAQQRAIAQALVPLDPFPRAVARLSAAARLQRRGSLSQLSSGPTADRAQ